MTDGVKFASNRIAILEAEIARLKEFVRVSEKLFRDGWLGTTDESKGSGHGNTKVSGTETVGKTSGTARKNDAVEGDDDLTARKPKSEEQMSALPAKKNGEDPDRKSLFRREQQ